MRTISILLFALILAPSVTNGQEPRKVDCHKDLKAAYELIDARWSFLVFKPGYVDLEREFDRLENEAKRTERPEECADIIARFMATLGDGHSSLHEYPGVEYTAPDIVLRTIRERLSRVPGEQPKPHVYVVSRDTTNDTLKSILPGSEIVAVDGQPVTELHEYWQARVAGSTNQWRDYRCDNRLLRGPANEIIELTLRSPSGRLSTVAVRRPEWKDEKEREREDEIYLDTARIATWERLEGGWGYLKYTDFAFKDDYELTVELFDEALDSLLDTPGLIIDVRGNGGGFVGAYLDAAGRFLDQETILSYFQVRQEGQYGVYEIYDSKTGDIAHRAPVRAKRRDPITRIRSSSWSTATASAPAKGSRAVSRRSIGRSSLVRRRAAAAAVSLVACGCPAERRSPFRGPSPGCRTASRSRGTASSLISRSDCGREISPLAEMPCCSARSRRWRTVRRNR